MTALTKFFFRSPYVTCRTPSEVIGWWEARRLPFNAAVGGAGIVTLSAAHLLAALPPHSHPLPFLPSLAVAGIYGILANVCYTGGWMAELLIRKHGDESLEPVGPTLFRYGFVFSVGLTLFPIAIAALDEAVRIVSAVFFRG
jgi:hypothetical protein